MTKPRRAAAAFLALLILSGCSPRTGHEQRETAETEPAPTTGITIFGDARLGVTLGPDP